MTKKLKTTKAPSSNLIRKQKENFFYLLKNNHGIEEAVEKSGLGPENFEKCMKNKSFLSAFDKIINMRLETAFLDAVLKSKTPSLITFALTSRLGDKYSKAKPLRPSAETPPEIAYIEENINEQEN